MPDPIDPISLSQIFPEEEIPKAVQAPLNITETSDPFSVILDRAVKSLEDVSALEESTNNLIKNYAAGQVGLQEVMVSTAKLSITVQLAVTAITSAVNTFKEITQMQV